MHCLGNHRNLPLRAASLVRPCLRPRLLHDTAGAVSAQYEQYDSERASTLAFAGWIQENLFYDIRSRDIPEPDQARWIAPLGLGVCKS